MKQNHILQKFGHLAKEYLENSLILETHFSGLTYQIEMMDKESGNLVFPFLQFDSEIQLKDCFCSCEFAEDSNECVHLAASLFHIYHGNSLPLHYRFNYSLWNQLGLIAVENIGYEIQQIKKKSEGNYFAQNSSGSLAFYIQSHSQEATEKLSRLIEKRAKETEETSIKFSNLSQEEINRWKEGRPTPQLRYELSFWTDLAKWFMLLQEDEYIYTISFEAAQGSLPDFIHIDWGFVKAGFLLTSQNLVGLIPALDTVISPLKVYKPETDKIEEILYEKENQVFRIRKKKQQSIDLQKDEHGESISIGEWIYMPEIGFYSIHGAQIFKNGLVAKQQIPMLLENHRGKLKTYLKNETVHEGIHPLHYHLYFDKEWNLHIKCFLLEPGDLNHQFTAFYGNWVYVNEKGFFQLAENLFGAAEKIISKLELSSFINLNRIWLNNQMGFQTHISILESQLTYLVSDEGILKFFSRTSSEPDEGEGSKDFGEWIYFKGEGFYSKLSGRNGVLLRPGIEVAALDIPSFIRKAREELENVNQFFIGENPIVEVGLKIELKSQSKIIITPQYKFLPAYQQLKHRFFGDFVYIEKMGFYELPYPMRLPERFREKVTIGDDLINFFIRYELDALKKWVIFLDHRLFEPQTFTLEVENSRKDEAGKIIADPYYRTNVGKVYVAHIQKALRKGKRYLFSDAGLIDLQEEQFQWIRKISLHKELDDPFVALSFIEFLKLEAIHGLKVTAKDQKNDLFKELREFQTSVEPNLEGLKSDLRLYQKTGLKWLWFLFQNHLSGLLCDDMGLGKTHQAMALIAAIKNHFPEQKLKFLVVCPTSVIYHWQDKLQRFLPQLNVIVFHGMKRSLEEFSSCDILLTSYGILRTEKETLQQISFDLAIYDEIQVAKNAHSRVHSALLVVNAAMKLGLTGTPIENNLRELKSLFDIVLKGYMPNDVQFKELFINPIEKEGSEERKQMLAKLIKPFTLRRKKIEVLQELPEKTEENSYCELSRDQIHFYNDFINQHHRELVSKLKNQKDPIPYVHVFAVLSTLKQICDHPALILKTPQDYKLYTSGKWNLFVELLNEVCESGQKVVVFSQYLMMLDIMVLHLQENGIEFAQIRGETINRSDEMRRFQEDPSCKVFLGSLQAAGLGIDLTAASVVIHYDRWWNAARENQATDRVHRIGQKRGVQVFKLITMNTLEEKIDRLIEKKGRLLEEIILSDDEQQIKKFTREELLDLLNPLEISINEIQEEP